jgi:hypothetical protein
LGLDYRPLFKSRSRRIENLISNWFLDSILTIRSSPPVDLLLLRDIGFGVYPLRPDLLNGRQLYLEDASIPGGRRINAAALSVSTEERQGNLGRNFFRGFPLSQLDMAIGRNFSVVRRLALSVRVEAFNVLNHPNFASPAGQLGRVDSSGMFVVQNGFGVATNTLAQGLQASSFGFNPLYQVGGARSLQLAFRATF